MWKPIIEADLIVLAISILSTFLNPSLMSQFTLWDTNYMKENFMTVQFVHNRSNMNILMNMNTCNSNNFNPIFSSNFGAHFLNPEMDCTYHTSDHVASRDNIPRHLKLIKCRFNNEMMTVFWCFNNLLETTATPKQRLRNALVTNIRENSQDELQRYFTTPIAQDQFKSKISYFDVGRPGRTLHTI